MVEHSLREAGVGGSNPLAPTRCLDEWESCMINRFDWKKYKLLLIAAIVFLLIAVVFMLKRVFDQETKEAANVAPAVIVSTATFGPVVRYINAIGTLSPYDSVDIKSEVEGRIEKIHFTEGTSVEAGALLVELDDKRATAELLEAEAQYRRAKSEFDPVDKLANKGVAARVERDKKKAELDSYAARVEACKINVEKRKIVAPFGGVVGLKTISKGQFVTPGTELVKVVDCYPLKVDFKVAEGDIGNVRVGQEITVLVEGDKRNEYTARVIAIDPECEKISHSFNVRAQVDIPEDVAANDKVLMPGRFVSVRISLDEGQEGILIPESAIEKLGMDNVVYIVRDNVAIRVLVTLGTNKNGNVEVITGVNEGDLVVTRGQAGILDGHPVRIQGDFSTTEIAQAYKASKQTKGK